jgi:hypothetical protein
MKSIDPSQAVKLKEEIQSELESIQVHDSGRLRESSKDLKQKKKKLILESDEDEEEEDLEDFSVDKELKNYMKEPKLKEDADPLKDFWKLKANLYPKLSILARKYLCVKATY